MARDLVLAVEDSPLAAGRIRRALRAKGVPFLLLSVVLEVDGQGLKGFPFDHPGEVEEASWARVKALFCDYSLPGKIQGDQVVKQADLASVPAIVGMSSSDEFNARLRAAGATRTHRKAVVLGGLETGAFDSLLPDQGSPKS